jgi:hypothetical protein
MPALPGSYQRLHRRGNIAGWRNRSAALRLWGNFINENNGKDQDFCEIY